MSPPPSDDFTTSGASSSARTDADNTNTFDKAKLTSDAPITARIMALITMSLSAVWGKLLGGFEYGVKMLKGTTDKHKGLSGYFYPTTAVREDEEVVHSDNPSRYYFLAQYAGAGLLFAASIMFTLIAVSGYGDQLFNSLLPVERELPEKWWVFPLLMTTFGIGILVMTILQRTSTWHIITNKRVLERDHILSKDVQRISFGEIKTIEGKHPFPDRLAGIGAIDIYTASTGGREMRFSGVPKAEHLANEIDELRYKYLQQFRHQAPDEAFDNAGEYGASDIDPTTTIDASSATPSDQPVGNESRPDYNQKSPSTPRQNGTFTHEEDVSRQSTHDASRPSTERRNGNSTEPNVEPHRNSADDARTENKSDNDETNGSEDDDPFWD